MAAKVVKPKVKVAPERRGTKKIWNISDWPATSVASQSVMVMGQVIPPGGVIEVPEERLKKAHKTEKDKASGLLFVGDKPPAEYMAWKASAPRARLPKGMNRTHGKSMPKPEAPAATPEAAPAEPPPVPVEPAMVEASAPAEEPKPEETTFDRPADEGNGKGRKGRR